MNPTASAGIAGSFSGDRKQNRPMQNPTVPGLIKIFDILILPLPPERFFAPQVQIRMVEAAMLTVLKNTPSWPNIAETRGIAINPLFVNTVHMRRSGAFGKRT